MPGDSPIDVCNVMWSLNLISYSTMCVLNFYIGATVQLSQTSTSVSEGNSGNTTVNMCLELTDAMDGLRRDVIVNIATQDRTAC